MRAVRIGGVAAQLLEQKPGGEDVDAHRGQAVPLVARDRLGSLRLLLETDDPILRIHLHHAELLSRLAIDPQGSDRQVRIDALVVLDHRAVVHLVDVVAGQNDDVAGPLLLQGVDVLIDGVGRALIPVLVDALLRRARCR